MRGKMAKNEVLPNGKTSIRTEKRPEHYSLVQLVQSWIDEGDADEQRVTLEYLIRVLDKDRPSNRKLFPKELKGKSW